MTTRKRVGASKRLRVTKRARTPARTSTRKRKGAPRPLPLSRTYAPELIALIRHRYENTPEPVAHMAADLGIHPNSVHRLAKNREWIRRNLEPKGMSRALKLLQEAEAVTAQAVPSPRLRGEGGEHRVLARCEPGEGASPPVECLEGPPHPISSLRSEIDLSPQAEKGEDANSAATAEPEPTNTPAILDRLERAVLNELTTVEAMRTALGAVPQKPIDAERTVRTLGLLTQTLQHVQRLRAGTVLPQSGFAYDDMPADIDEFRNELARRIDAFVESRTQQGADGDPGPASPVAPA